MTWTLSGAISVLSAQLLLGIALYCAVACALRLAAPRGRVAGRRRLAGWTEASRYLRRMLPYPLAVLTIAGPVCWWTGRGAGPAATLPVWISTWAFVAAGALPLASVYLMLRAGRLEHRGRRHAARREIRLGGLMTLVGVVPLLALVWGDVLFRPADRAALLENPTAAILFTFATVAIACAAFVAALAGLSGKSRPSGQLAALLYLAGLLALMTAAGLAEYPGGPGEAAPAARVAALFR